MLNKKYLTCPQMVHVQYNCKYGGVEVQDISSIVPKRFPGSPLTISTLLHRPFQTVNLHPKPEPFRDTLVFVRNKTLQVGSSLKPNPKP